MFETQCDVLAEFSLKNQTDTVCVKCLCSRSFIRTKASSKQLASSEQSASEEDNQIEDELNRIYENLTIQSVQRAKSEENEPEAASCYCSASHTDNLSTDEHESLREAHNAPSTRGIQQSDSGTDLNEHPVHDIDADWHRFWSINGEKLIWESWIEKYSHYINPEYLLPAQKEPLDDHKLESSKRFKQESLKKDKSQSELLRTLSGGSDEKVSLSNDVSEGWNPLSTIDSIEDDAEAEKLLASRCCSRTGGSLRTIDSITNVTRMTVSSLDFSEAGASGSSESFSSVSSADGSVSSEDSDEDYQRQWNELWKRHYEDQYAEQYNKFVRSAVGASATDSSKPVMEMSNSDRTLEAREWNEDGKSVADADSLSSCESEEENTIYKEMAAMGLPVTFRSKGTGSSNRSDSLKMSTSNYDFNAGRNRIKSAFNLIGLEFQEPSDEVLTGDVNYKMKHIRQQNRHLKIRPQSKKPRHFTFDDDGNMYEKEPDELVEQNVFCEQSDNELSSCEEAVTGEAAPPACDESAAVDEVQKTKRKRRKRKQPVLPAEIRSNAKLRKYWCKRFSLFSRWYSVTPEQVARHTAERCQCDIIVDAFCGAGGNAIQFAMKCTKVIAIDVDPKKIELARNNAGVYGVSDRIEFVVGDFFRMADKLKADAVFLSPPWGGPAYLQRDVYDLETMLQPAGISRLMLAARKISPNVAVFLPRNSNTFALTKEAGVGGRVEVEQNFINKKLVAITAYYNDLIKEK
ncbi:unnamed protein product [Phyllotreta striolata]|uniref:Trimethylguanosine synthase n=1 Tax=Phyllotreta striolata TaxID=444603 RepID=A0A9N9TMH6_PHYSR|nr:unnamed protein product [Phyllotreta striolata]